MVAGAPRPPRPPPPPPPPGPPAPWARAPAAPGAPPGPAPPAGRWVRYQASAARPTIASTAMTVPIRRLRRRASGDGGGGLVRADLAEWFESMFNLVLLAKVLFR
ncbi:MAG: hypothetical protein EOP92_02935 [Lysobacteraceae bacterium]|nr:MAG: hypothetical protein EOP92_02935 [Xanthomonadaceae bacterium]